MTPLGLRPNTIKVAEAILSSARNGRCCVGQRALADMAGFGSLHTIKPHIEILIECGFVTVIRGRGRRPDTYIVAEAEQRPEPVYPILVATQTATQTATQDSSPTATQTATQSPLPPHTPLSPIYIVHDLDHESVGRFVCITPHARAREDDVKRKHTHKPTATQLSLGLSVDSPKEHRQAEPPRSSSPNYGMPDTRTDLNVTIGSVLAYGEGPTRALSAYMQEVLGDRPLNERGAKWLRDLSDKWGVEAVRVAISRCAERVRSGQGLEGHSGYLAWISAYLELHGKRLATPDIAFDPKNPGFDIWDASAWPRATELRARWLNVLREHIEAEPEDIKAVRLLAVLEETEFSGVAARAYVKPA